MQKLVIDANCAPYLLSIIRTLSYYLVDLDEIRLENNGEMLKTINRLMLVLLETSEPKHILEVLFIMMR